MSGTDFAPWIVSQRQAMFHFASPPTAGMMRAR
jgi:hypothetical protein